MFRRFSIYELTANSTDPRYSSVSVGYELSSKKKKRWWNKQLLSAMPKRKCSTTKHTLHMGSDASAPFDSPNHYLWPILATDFFYWFNWQFNWTTRSVGSAQPCVCACTNVSNVYNFCFATGRIRQLESVPDISALQHTEGLNKGHHASSGVHGSLPRSRSRIMRGDDKG